MRIFRLINDNFERIVGGVCLGVVVTLIFLGVVMRVGFNTGLPWQEELSRVLFVLMIYIGACFGTRRNEHLRVTILHSLLPKSWQEKLDLLNDIAWIIFNILVVWYSAKSLFGPMSRFAAYTAYLNMDMRIPFAVVPVLTLLQTVRLIEGLFRRHLRKEDKETSCS